MNAFFTYIDLNAHYNLKLTLGQILELIYYYWSHNLSNTTVYNLTDPF